MGRHGSRWRGVLRGAGVGDGRRRDAHSAFRAWSALRLGAILPLAFVWMAGDAAAQAVGSLIVEIKTADKRFAGTDDPIQLQIGGQSFNLDNPGHDDFERDNLDRFELPVAGGRLTVELIRAVGILSVSKLEDSFFGGGWAFEGITVWVNSDASPPIYRKTDVDLWLDGDRLSWAAMLDDAGWSFPDPPPPFPPCTLGDVDTGLLFDSDCDGIPDDSDDSFNPVDTDGDGLPDGYEDQAGTGSTDPDSDDDGWWDGGNRRSSLLLVRVTCLDEEEDAGRDEIYLTAEDARFPLAANLDGYWALDDGSEIFPGVIVDSRSLPPAGAGPAAAFSTRFRLRESDPTVIEGPTDDTYKSFETAWGETGDFEIVHDVDDAHYILQFRAFTTTFADPEPLADGDTDGDGLAESKERAIAVQDPSAQATPVAGYDGLADPAWRDAFVEVDAVGSDNTVPYDAKQMVVSQFRNRYISLRLDDGYLGGGQELPYEETLTMEKLRGPDYRGNPSNFSPVRADHFRYGLLSDRVEGEGSFGVGSFSPVNGGFIVAHLRLLVVDLGHTMTAQYTPILIMHEMGHTFNLCHRAGDKGETAPASCPATPGDRCARYCDISSTAFVDQASVTAMGSDTLFDLIVELGVVFIASAATGALIGAAIGAAIAGPLGAVIGGILGGLGLSIFGVSQADIFTRFVDYHWIEWAALRFWP